MSDKLSHSLIINIPQPRTFTQASECNIKIKNLKKRICDNAVTKPSEASLRKYSLTGNRPLQLNALKNDGLLLPFKLYSKKQASVDHKQCLGIKLDEKYKIINTDLRKRLHVEDPPDDVQTVTDIDEGYFKYLKAHHLVQYIPLYKSLKLNFHERIRMRHEVGYRLDGIDIIEAKHRKEVQAYEDSVLKYADQVKQFEVFISEDYKKSIACLKKSEDLIAVVHGKQLGLEHLANGLFLTQSRLIGLDYLYFMQQKYGRFLYYLSPPSWRAKHRDFARSVEIEVKGFDLGNSSEEDTFNVIFENMQNECLGGLIQPALYFSSPDVLMSVFEGIEKQQLYHFTLVTHLYPLMKTLKETLNNLKISVKNDCDFIAHTIKDIVNLLDFFVERESYLQAKFMKILHGLFYESVAATDVLKLQMHLEFCYEKLYIEKPNMSLLSSAKALENMYMEYSFQLDDIINDDLKLAMKHCIESEKKKLKKAHKAAREMRLFDRLEHSMLLAFEMPNHNKDSLPPIFKQPLVRKPERQLPKPIVKLSSQREFTDAEIEYLSLFTNWTETENPADYLH